MMDILDTPRQFPQFGKHLSSLVRPRSEVFKGKKGGKGSCGCGSGAGSCGCGGKGSCGCDGAGTCGPTISHHEHGTIGVLTDVAGHHQHATYHTLPNEFDRCWFPECDELKDQVARYCDRPISTLEPDRERRCQAAKVELRKCCDHYASKNCDPLCKAKAKIFSVCCQNARHRYLAPGQFQAAVDRCRDLADYNNCSSPPCPPLACDGPVDDPQPPDSPWINPTFKPANERPRTCLEWAQEIYRIATIHQNDSAALRIAMYEIMQDRDLHHSGSPSDGWNAAASANARDNIAHFAGVIAFGSMGAHFQTLKDVSEWYAAKNDRNTPDDKLSETEAEIYADLASAIIQQSFSMCLHNSRIYGYNVSLCREVLAGGFYNWFCREWV